MSPLPGADVPEGAGRLPVLVLGVGNLLLQDDGIGLRILGMLQADPAYAGAAVEFVDGGTQGLALIGLMTGRPGMLVMDAVRRGQPPGTVHELDGAEAIAMAAGRADTAHEGGAGHVLAIAQLMGDLPARVRVVGVEPQIVETGIGLSPAVEAALPEAVRCARAAIGTLGVGAR